MNLIFPIDELQKASKGKELLYYKTDHHLTNDGIYVGYKSLMSKVQKDFPDVNLDREQNIVSLCSHCHNLLHYGADIDSVLYKLYTDRKDLLKLIGIEISYEDLRKYYM